MTATHKNHKKTGMKLKTLLAGLLATFLLQQTVLSQTNVAAADQPAVAADTNGTVTAVATNMPDATNTPDAATPAAAATDTATNAADAATPAATAADTATNAATAITPAATAADSATNAPADNEATASPSIPLIQFQDVPLTTAIENLARQANINYLLDPKISYGQPDATGQVKAEPNLSIRWENITAQNALIALLDNYGLQLVADVKTKIYRITTKDPTALPPLSTQVIQLKYASTTNMMDSVQATFSDKRSRVFPDTRTSQLIVVATDAEQAAVETLVAQLDTPTKQVLIETKLIEINSNPTSKKGIDWSGTLSSQHVSFGNNVNGGQSGNPYSVGLSQTVNPPPLGNVITTTYGPNNLLGTPGLLMDTAHGFNPTTGFLNADGAAAVLSFLNSSEDAQVMSTPRVVTLDNETANISVLRTYPILNTTAGTQGSPGGSSITYSNVGTVLQVTPRVSANNTIRLRVTPDVETFFGYLTLSAQGGSTQAPQFDIRTMDTQVLIPNANTLVMGGLVDDNPIDAGTKVPVLGDVPYLGALFRSSSKVGDKKNLLIFITPTILQDSDFHPTTTDFLNSQAEKKPETLNPNSLWDSTMPYNWADPKNTDPDQKVLNQPSTQ
jgi:type II secretory pathway component GspD/PulD (secretin)